MLSEKRRPLGRLRWAGWSLIVIFFETGFNKMSREIEGWSLIDFFYRPGRQQLNAGERVK